MNSDRRKLDAYVILLAAFMVAIAMRAYGLNGHFDYDGYDEGVYWQTLRAMNHGYSLYRDIFCSQPPVFPLSIYPFYVLFGSSILAARIGVATISLLGLVGAYLLGRAPAGRAGGIAAVVVVVATPLYLQASQTLQAEGPATALLLLAAGAAFMWREHPTGRNGLLLASLCGVALLLGVPIKLLDVTAIVLAFALAAERLWRIRRDAGSRVGTVLWPIAGAALVTTIVAVIVLAPVRDPLPALVRQVVTFHLAAGKVVHGSWTGNAYRIYQFARANAALMVAALVGLVAAVSRRDSRVIAVIAWLAATCIVLLVQTPLFPRHAIVLVPPLIAAAVLGLSGLPSAKRMRPTAWTPRQDTKLLAGLCIFAVIISGALSEHAYYRTLAIRAESSDVQLAAQLADDLQRATTPDQWVITDAQFIAGLADRNTPPSLADTSSVRISSLYLTSADLIQAASDPRVHAVLFATNRLASPSLVAFHSWMAQHYHPFRDYGAGIELWTR